MVVRFPMNSLQVDATTMVAACWLIGGALEKVHVQKKTILYFFQSSMTTHRICKISYDALLFDEVKRVIGLSEIKFTEPPLTVKSTINEYFNSKQVRDVSELLDKSPHGIKAMLIASSWNKQ